MKTDSYTTISKAYDDITEFGTNLIKAAGQRLLADVGQISSEPKGKFDLVTATDVAVESFILTEIRARFPQHHIIAEESLQPDQVILDDFCWVVDPLDGTVNFALGIPFFSISIAVLYGGSPVLGWVYDPVRQELFYARRDGGSFVNNHRLTIGPEEGASLLPVGGSSGFLTWCLETDPASILQALMSRFGKVRILGSQALQLCYVAAGRLRATISWECRLWDDVAGALIVREAGGRYTNFWNNPIFPLTLDSPLLAGEAIQSVAAMPDTHREVLALFAQFQPATATSSPANPPGRR